MRARALLTVLGVTALVLPLAGNASAAPPTGHLYYSADTDGDVGASIWRTDGSTTEAVVDDGHDNMAVSVSPDGTKLAYSSDADGTGYYHVYVRDVSGGTPLKLTSGAFDHERPEWSPDGATIVFQRRTYPSEFLTTMRVPAAGGASVAVSNGLHSAQPNYSPSGRQLMVTRLGATDTSLGIITLGSGQLVGVSGSAGAYAARWSPDGTKVAFIRDNSETSFTLYTMAVRGGAVTALVTGLIANPQWSNDGSVLFYEDYDVGQTRPGYINRVDAGGGGITTVVALSNDDAMMPDFFGTPPAPDSTPPAMPATSFKIESGKVTATWTMPADATEMVVRRATGTTPPGSIATGVHVFDGIGSSVAATGLTNGTTYSISVFAIDAWGNVGPPATFTFKPVAIPAVTTPAVESSASTTRAWVVKWGVPAGGGSPSGYDVDYGVRVRASNGTWSAPVWTAWKVNTTATSSPFSGNLASTYYFRVRARDGLGNMTPFALPRATSVPLDNTYYAIAWSPGWALNSSAAGRWYSTLRSATTANRTMTFTTETQGFSVVGDRCTACGVFRVYVDGVLRATVDSRGPTTQVRQVLWTATLPGGVKSHQIRVVALGTPGRPQVRIDALGLYR